MSEKPFYLEEEQEHERRLSKRVLLDMPYFFTVRIDESAPFKVMLTDISTSGAKIVLPPACAILGVPGKSRVYFMDFPSELEVFRSISGYVIWTGDEHLGIMFDNPLEISLEELSAIIDTL